MLMNNGYSREWLEDVIGKFLNSKYSNKCKMFGPEQRTVYIRLPFLGDASEKGQGSIRSCLSSLRCGSVRVNISYDYNRVGGAFPYKDRQPKHLASGLVYKVSCTCGKYYIGESGRCCYVRFRDYYYYY